MQEIFQAMIQLGTAPVVAGVLLWDYSKKLAGMQNELIKINERLENIVRLMEK